ncbi:MAG: flagellar export chaperone FliS [Oscillospiraceae bacterium]|nr:flagellar export chaperone FliS [Oscillospiraceae bacterium]
MQQMVITSSPQEAYRRQDVLTASSGDLIMMLYDALKKNIILGRRDIEKKNIARAHNHLMKAQDIVSELINSLDMNYGISEELLKMYEFMLRKLQEANINKDVEPLVLIIEMVDNIREVWKEICSTNKGSVNLSENQA